MIDWCKCLFVQRHIFQHDSKTAAAAEHLLANVFPNRALRTSRLSRTQNPTRGAKESQKPLGQSYTKVNCPTSQEFHLLILLAR